MNGDGFKERVKTQRQLHNLTQQSLAEKIGVSHSYIQQMEYGTKKNPSGEVLIELSKTFGVTTDYLLGLEE